MKLFSSFIVVLGLGICACVGAQSRHASSMVGATVVSIDETEVAHVERLFSNGTHTTPRPAPTIWSSRLEVRWNARWQNAPRYAV